MDNYFYVGQGLPPHAPRKGVVKTERRINMICRMEGEYAALFMKRDKNGLLKLAGEYDKLGAANTAKKIRREANQL